MAAIGRLGAKGARPGVFVWGGDRQGVVPPPTVAPSIGVMMRAAPGPVYEIAFNGPALVYAVYANGTFDVALSAAPGQATWTNPSSTPIVGVTPPPGKNQAPNVLGSELPPGPGGVSAIAVYFNNEGVVRGVQFNGPANVQIQNADGTLVYVSNAAASGTPTRWANTNT